MKLVRNPTRETWGALTSRALQDDREIEALVDSIFKKVADSGDGALFELTRAYDRVDRRSLRYSTEEIDTQARKVNPKLLEALSTAAQNIERFHQAQVSADILVEPIAGVRCWRRALPVSNVGLYVPGGTAPLASTLLMLAIPAQIAGCERIVVCTPPQPDGSIAPVTAAAARILGVNEIYSLGGAQAIAALTLGTKSVSRVDKIFGPGNRYVTKAKQLATNYGIAIDMPAGPSELLVIADETANPQFIAADLLSQAEHGPDSQVILVSNSEEIITQTLEQIKVQLTALPRREIAERALNNSKAILVGSIAEALELSNFYAPEHLIISTTNASKLSQGVTACGSVFIGTYSPESVGDYASGTNHTLPTAGFARSYSGVTTESYKKFISFQELSKEGLFNLANTVQELARAEGLEGHANAVSIRLKEGI